MDRFLAGYPVAVVAAGVSYSIFLALDQLIFGNPLFAGLLEPQTGHPLARLLNFTAFNCLMIAGFALVPAIFAVAVLRMFGWQGSVPSALAGVAASLMALQLSSIYLEQDFTWPIAFAGAFGGLAYRWTDAASAAAAKQH